MVFHLLLALMPWRIHAWVLRRRGGQIDPSAKISWGALIVTDKIQMGPGARIGPFTAIRSYSLTLEANATIAGPTFLSAHTIALKERSGISYLNFVTGNPSQDRSRLTLGRHSRVFPFCWLEAGHAIDIGDRVGIGGHGLIFTHGSWANYFLGAPVSFGPVTIEERTWLPWRVFVMPNVTIGARSVIGAGSVVTRSVPADSLAAGAPAKVLRNGAYTDLSTDELNERISAVLREFLGDHPQLDACQVLQLVGGEPGADEASAAKVIVGGNIPTQQALNLHCRGVTVIDLATETQWLSSDDSLGRAFGTWITRYGVRLDPGEGSRR